MRTTFIEWQASEQGYTPNCLAMYSQVNPTPKGRGLHLAPKSRHDSPPDRSGHSGQLYSPEQEKRGTSLEYCKPHSGRH
jgi:hypothetical protein